MSFLEGVGLTVTVFLAAAGLFAIGDLVGEGWRARRERLKICVPPRWDKDFLEVQR